MNGKEFIRRARRYARRNGIAFRFDPRRGKGSHGVVYVGERLTTVPQKELATGLLGAMLKDLDINREEF